MRIYMLVHKMVVWQPFFVCSHSFFRPFVRLFYKAIGEKIECCWCASWFSKQKYLWWVRGDANHKFVVVCCYRCCCCCFSFCKKKFFLLPLVVRFFCWRIKSIIVENRTSNSFLNMCAHNTLCQSINWPFWLYHRDELGPNVCTNHWPSQKTSVHYQCLFAVQLKTISTFTSSSSSPISLSLWYLVVYRTVVSMQLHKNVIQHFYFKILLTSNKLTRISDCFVLVLFQLQWLGRCIEHSGKNERDPLAGRETMELYSNKLYKSQTL